MKHLFVGVWVDHCVYIWIRSLDLLIICWWYTIVTNSNDDTGSKQSGTKKKTTSRHCCAKTKLFCFGLGWMWHLTLLKMKILEIKMVCLFVFFFLSELNRKICISIDLRLLSNLAKSGIEICNNYRIFFFQYCFWLIFCLRLCVYVCNVWSGNNGGTIIVSGHWFTTKMVDHSYHFFSIDSSSVFY